MKNICVVLIVFVVVVSSVYAIPTTSSNVIVRKCEEVGGYCQTSWDCCSNRCLSFSYKCVKGPPLLSSSSVVSIIPLDSEHITVDTLEELINRFGGGDDDKTLATPTTTTTSASTSSSIIENNFSSTQCTGIGYECADSSQCCSNDCLHYMNINICIQNRNSTVTNPPPVCLAIGRKCYRNEECCTTRCHGYLHQCVT